MRLDLGDAVVRIDASVDGCSPDEDGDEVYDLA
jgi:hypothetical protein